MTRRPHLLSGPVLALALALTLFALSPSPALAESMKVAFATSKGDFVVELLPDKAPISVRNFLTYVAAGDYDGTIFHRVIDGFMIQGGGYDRDFIPRPTRKPIRNEADNGLKNTAYTIAMARTNQPHSATSQFFINVRDNDFLNHTAKTEKGWGYAVFGKVVSGADTVDAIKSVRTSDRGYIQNVPETPVVILSATLLDQGAQ